MRLRRTRRRTALVLAAAVGVAAVAATPTVADAHQQPATLAATSTARQEDPGTPAARVPYRLVEDRPVDDRLPEPEDRYAPAGGCYTLEAPGAGHVARSGDRLVLVGDSGAAEPFHFQATRLGEYLIATNEGRDTRHDDAWWDRRGYVAIGRTGLLRLRTEVMVAGEPSPQSEWRLVAAGADPEARNEDGQEYLLSVPSRDSHLTVRDGALVPVSDGSSATGFRLHHVPDDDLGDGDADGTACATWPEIETGTSGPPAPARRNPAGAVRGFFEAHVHGMAYEFLGGELRCGRPWHPYGVEHALGDCRDDGKLLNPLLEVALADDDPTTYDPVGWPTFDSWPRHELLTHEQWYWKWLERAHHGGLRLMTNLLVDNTALCQAYPQKRNSCNEMDSVRLQAQRLFELQDYIDAQSGGPGEGWFRIVTTPAQAREVINAGRLAVVMGIEVSILFDCGETLDVPHCTAEQIDDRLQEVLDMGVRQMEITNKFDNALSGVTGDPGATGLIVNQGNRQVTGHHWDMRTCPAEADHGHGDHIHGTQHDKTQLNPWDDTPLGGTSDEVDVLAGAILAEFGGVLSTAAPLYPAAPHCNERGLTALGEHLIREMARRGVIFDPDHMSASAQRAALDLIEGEIVPAERAAARAAGRPPRAPGIISSHSWANDVVYQRIYALGGTVAPRTGDAAAFVDAWATHRGWADELAPRHMLFGLGYGADTNGFGAQPGPRAEPSEPLVYTDGGWEAPIGGVRIHQQRSGLRTFDVNHDGVAHYGLFADWFRELQLEADARYGHVGGADAVTTDMLAGAENYLRMWERAVYGGNDCVSDQSTLQPEDLHALLGGDLEGFLRAAGQPVDRDGAAYTYCVTGDDGSLLPLDVLFGDDGTAVAVQPHSGDVVADP